MMWRLRRAVRISWAILARISRTFAMDCFRLSAWLWWSSLWISSKS